MVKVYEGGLPTGGYDENIGGTAYGVSSEAESSYTPGDVDAADPKLVKGGPTPAKTYDKNASQDFVLDSSYKTNLEIAGRPANAKTVNPNDLSNEDHC